MWQERWEWWGWVLLAKSGWSSIGQWDEWTTLGARLKSRKGSSFGSCFLQLTWLPRLFLPRL